MRKRRRKRDRTSELLFLSTKLEPIEFFGLATTLGVPLYEDKEEKPFAQILEELLISFKNLKKRSQEEILVLVRAATSPEED